MGRSSGRPGRRPTFASPREEKPYVFRGRVRTPKCRSRSSNPPPPDVGSRRRSILGASREVADGGCGAGPAHDPGAPDVALHGRRAQARTGSSTSAGTRPTCGAIEYDPNRTARIARILHRRRETLHPRAERCGSSPGHQPSILPGNALPLRGSRSARSTTWSSSAARPAAAGQGRRLRAGAAALRRGSAGPHRVLRHDQRQVGNIEHENVSRWRDPLDERRRTPWRAEPGRSSEQGGGEGCNRSHPTSPWGWKTEGLKTRTTNEPTGLPATFSKSLGTPHVALDQEGSVRGRAPLR